ncbi:MAG: hypothetical protein JW818_19300, partial [Pirellulales bacterium]|nr:hypothetical protein [Pirellulales bacterium]
NTASRPVDAAGSEGVVVHTVGVGATLRSDLTHRDIQLTGLDCPDRLMLNNRAKATASVEAIGLEGRVVQVVLEDDGQPIDHVELTLDNAEGSQTVEFEFRPTTPGRHIYSARVAPVSEEKITQNNQRAAVAIVVEPGIRVLYLEGTLRAEYGTLVDRFLAKDPDLEFCALVQTRPNVFLTRTNIEGLRLDNIPTDEATLDTFDVFILGDLDVSYLRPIQQELIVKRIRDGAGLVMLGGYHSLGPGGYEGTPLGAILPVRLGSREVGQVNEPFLPVLTPEGVRHPIFANIAEFFPTQAGPAAVPGLPPLEGCTRVEGPRAGATVLAKCPLDAEQPVVLAVQPVGAGRTAVFTGDTTRRWQQGPRAMGQDSPFLRFWGQMVRFLAGRQGDVAAEAGITGATDKAYYAPDEPVRVTATVRNDKGEAATEAEVVAEIFLIPEPTKHVPPVSEKNGGPRPVVAGQDDSVPTPGKLVSRNTLSAVPGPSGNYAGTFQPATPGTYQINLLARVGEKVLKAPRLDVEVGRPFLEYEKLDLNDRLLREIAEASGGRYVHLSTAEHLIDRLDQTVRQKQHHIERPLYWPPLVWPLFVGIVTLEWVLRRRFQLR